MNEQRQIPRWNSKAKVRASEDDLFTDCIIVDLNLKACVCLSMDLYRIVSSLKWL